MRRCGATLPIPRSDQRSAPAERWSSGTRPSRRRRELNERVRRCRAGSSQPPKSSPASRFAARVNSCLAGRSTVHPMGRAPPGAARCPGGVFEGFARMRTVERLGTQGCAGPPSRSRRASAWASGSPAGRALDAGSSKTVFVFLWLAGRWAPVGRERHHPRPIDREDEPTAPSPPPMRF